MSFSSVVQKILQTNKAIEPLLRESLKSSEGVSRLLQPDTIILINQITNLYDILGETLGQYNEQTNQDNESLL